MRQEERRQRDHDQVVEEKRPARDEADEVVERPPRERLGAARLGDRGRPFRVRERDEEEDDAREEQDERRQPERGRGDDPERDVDRGARSRRTRSRRAPGRRGRARSRGPCGPSAARRFAASSWMRATPSATNSAAEHEPEHAAAVRRRHDEQREPDHDEERAEGVDRVRGTSSSRRRPCARRGHHHPARRVSHHAVDGRAEDAAAPVDEILARRPEHDDLGFRGAPPRARSRPTRCGRGRAGRRRGRRRSSPIATASSSSAFATRSSSGAAASSGRSSGTSSTVSATTRAPRSAARRQATSSASSEGRPGTIGTTIRRYSSASAAPNAGGAFDRLAQGRADDPSTVDRVADEAEPRSSRARPSASSEFWTTITRNDAPVASPPTIAKTGQSTPPTRRFGRARTATARLDAAVRHADPHERRVGDGERECRAERVERADEVHVAREQDQRSARLPAKTTSESHGVLNRGWSRRKTSGICR